MTDLDEPSSLPPLRTAGDSWQVHAVTNRDEMARLGRAVLEDLADEAVRSTLLRARLG